MKVRALMRCDGGGATGSGHVMRCLALAEELVARGGSAVFVCNEPAPSLASRIIDAGHEMISLSATVGSDGDLRKSLAAARDSGANGIVVDRYGLSREYRLGLRQAGLPILSFDDTGKESAFADIVINASPAASRAAYEDSVEDTIFLLGPSYALIRRDVWSMRGADVSPDGILVTFGGSDPTAMTAPVVEALHFKLPDVSIHAIIGGSVVDGEQTARQLEKLPMLRISRDLPNLGAAISGAALVVSSASTTLYEIAVLGRPMVLCIVADNQGGLGNLEWADVVRTQNAEIVATRTAELWHDKQRANTMAHAARTVVDGHGAERIADALSRRIGALQ